MNLTYLVDRLADQTPDAPALWLAPGRARTWAETRQRMDRLACVLRAQGVRPGDRVGLLSTNRPEFLELLFAAARLGAMIVPFNYRLSPAELAFQIADAGLAVCFVEDACRATYDAADAACPTESLETDAFDALMAAGDPQPNVTPLPADAPFGIFYTGGTTGAPKGVILNHMNFLVNAANVTGAVHFDPADVHLHIAPMFHLADLGFTLNGVYAGGSHVFAARFRPAAALETIAAYRVTNTLLAPSMVGMLVRDPAVAGADTSSLRYLSYGGSPITDDVLREAMDRLGCGFSQGFGQTEATQTITILTPDDHRRALREPDLLRSCGRPVGSVALRLLDEDDRPAPRDEAGEIAISGPTVMAGYWNRPEETAAALRGGWLHTGDVGFRDSEGYLRIVDRKKDMIVSGAENVYSSEVENALAAHPAVAEAAVFAVPDDILGERVHAVLAPVAGTELTLDGIQDHCRKLIAGYKIPRSLEIVDSLPKTAFGKVQKAELRAAHWAGRDRGVA